jgi:predicted nucleotidyltransferase
VLLQATYPTPEHQAAADVIVEFFLSNYEIDAVLLVNSCARGKATRDSCLNIVVLAQPEQLRAQLDLMETGREEFEESNQVIKALHKVGRYSVVHPDFIHGMCAPEERDEAAGPDDFELGVGNFLAYSVPLWQGSDYLAQLKGQWLPFLSLDK